MVGLELSNQTTGKTVISGDTPYLYLFASVPAEYLVGNGVNTPINVIGYGRNDNVKAATGVQTVTRDYAWGGPSYMVVTISARKSLGIHYCFDAIRTGPNSMRIYYYAVGYESVSNSDFSWIDDWLQFDFYTQDRVLSDYSNYGLHLFDSNNKMSFSSNFTRVLDVRGVFQEAREASLMTVESKHVRTRGPAWGTYYNLGHSVNEYSIMPYSSERHFHMTNFNLSGNLYMFELVYGYGVVDGVWYQIQGLVTQDDFLIQLDNTSCYATHAWCYRGCSTELGRIWQINFGYETSLTVPNGAFCIGITNNCTIVLNVQTVDGVSTYYSNSNSNTLRSALAGSVCTAYVSMDNGYSGGVFQLSKCHFYDSNDNATNFVNATSVRAYEEERIIFSPSDASQVTFILPSDQTKGYVVRMLANPNNTGNAYYYKIKYSSRYYNLAIGIQHSKDGEEGHTLFNITENLDNPYCMYEGTNGHTLTGHYFIVIDTSGNYKWYDGFSVLCQLASNDGLPIYTYNKVKEMYMPYGASDITNTSATKTDINVIDFTKYVTSITEVTDLVNVSFYIPENVFGVLVVNYDTMSKTYNIGEGYNNIQIPRGANYGFAVGFNVDAKYRDSGIIVNGVSMGTESVKNGIGGTISADTNILFQPLICKNQNASFDLNILKDNKYSVKIYGTFYIFEGDNFIGSNSRFVHVPANMTECKITMSAFTENDYNYIPYPSIALKIFIESGYDGYNDYINNLAQEYCVFDSDDNFVGSNYANNMVIYPLQENQYLVDITDTNNYLTEKSVRTKRSLFYLPEHTYMDIFMYSKNDANTQVCYKKRIVGSADGYDFIDFYENDTVQINLYAESGYSLTSNGILYVQCAYIKPSSWNVLGSSVATLQVSFSGATTTIDGISYGFAFSTETPTAN